MDGTTPRPATEQTWRKTMTMAINIDELTIRQAREIAAMFPAAPAAPVAPQQTTPHPMIGRRCVIRTYSAGVHIGTVLSVKDGMEVHLGNSLRLWKWERGGLSLSVVANNGIKKGRLNRTGEIYLTNAIEFIPTTEDAEKSYVNFIED